MTDTRTYIRLHDGMPDHPKIDALSDKAFRLLIESWCWCSRHLTDGFIPERTWRKRGTPAARQQLLNEGLVEAVAGGVQMHDYLEHQRSADEVAAMREKRAEAGRKGGKAKARNVAKRVASASPGLKQTPSKSVASTETDTNTATDVAVVSDGSGAATSQPLVGEWLEHCGDKRPPKAVVGQVAKQVKALLDEGIPVGDVRQGLAAWHRKALHPSTLPSVVHETRIARPAVAAIGEGPDDWMRRRP